MNVCFFVKQLIYLKAITIHFFEIIMYVINVDLLPGF